MRNPNVVADISAYRDSSRQIGATSKSLAAAVQEFTTQTADASVLGTNDQIGKYANPMYRVAHAFVCKALKELAAAYDDHSQALDQAATWYSENERENQSTLTDLGHLQDRDPCNPGPYAGSPGQVGSQRFENKPMPLSNPSDPAQAANAGFPDAARGGTSEIGRPTPKPFEMPTPSQARGIGDIPAGTSTAGLGSFGPGGSGSFGPGTASSTGGFGPGPASTGGFGPGGTTGASGGGRFDLPSADFGPGATSTGSGGRGTTPTSGRFEPPNASGIGAFGPGGTSSGSKSSGVKTAGAGCLGSGSGSAAKVPSPGGTPRFDLPKADFGSGSGSSGGSVGSSTGGGVGGFSGSGGPGGLPPVPKAGRFDLPTMDLGSGGGSTGTGSAGSGSGSGSGTGGGLTSGSPGTSAAGGASGGGIAGTGTAVGVGDGGPTARVADAAGRAGGGLGGIGGGAAGPGGGPMGGGMAPMMPMGGGAGGGGKSSRSSDAQPKAEPSVWDALITDEPADNGEEGTN